MPVGRPEMLSCSYVPATGAVSPGAYSGGCAKSSLALFHDHNQTAGRRIDLDQPPAQAMSRGQKPPAVARQGAKFHYDGGMRVYVPLGYGAPVPRMGSGDRKKAHSVS
jgi:hypothetical protein